MRKKTQYIVVNEIYKTIYCGYPQKRAWNLLETEVGEISHVGPIIISDLAHLGDNCRIHIDVNIGADARNGKLAPQIGNNVYIAPGAKIFGGITIAESNGQYYNQINNSTAEKQKFGQYNYTYLLLIKEDFSP